MDPQCRTCGHPDCRLDAEGWCLAHGWDCADYHLRLRDELDQLAALGLG